MPYEERWVPVLGFEDLYSVSNLGRIKRTKPYRNSPTTPMKLGVDSFGYPQARLHSEGKRHTKRMHRLVAEAFLGIPDGMTVNHLNGVKTDNRLENLEVCTHRQNERHKRLVLNKHTFPGSAKLTIENVAAIRMAIAAGATNESQAKKYNISRVSVSRIKNMKAWKHPH